MEEIFIILLLGIGLVVAALLTTQYEAIAEAILAGLMVVPVIVGFCFHPRKDIFYVHTAIHLVEPSGHITLQRDFVALRVELARLWMLFVPTLIAVAFLVVSSSSGVLWKFSLLNTIALSKEAALAFYAGLLLVVTVIALLAVWVRERRIMGDVEACAARSRSRAGHSVSYQFMGEKGEYYGGHGRYFGLVHPPDLASIVFYNPRKPDVNVIAMGLLFHRLVVLGRGVTELDKQTLAAQIALAETVT